VGGLRLDPGDDGLHDLGQVGEQRMSSTATRSARASADARRSSRRWVAAACNRGAVGGPAR
jgi:hypothetical protein